jgi:hypothetical protein
VCYKSIYSNVVAHVNCPPRDTAIFRIAAIVILITTATVLGRAQRRGSITGTISPVNRGVVVVATNQVTSQVTNSETNSAGNYSLSLRPGAYRLSVESPFTARFDKTKDYGEHALVREDSLENVIVSEGKETKIDFAVARVIGPQLVNPPPRKPLGAAGRASVESEPQTQSDHRESRDRWRIGFPSTIAMALAPAVATFCFAADVGTTLTSELAERRYPVFGNKVFMIFAVRDHRIKSTPKPSDVSSARNGSAEFFGYPNSSP